MGQFRLDYDSRPRCLRTWPWDARTDLDKVPLTCASSGVLVGMGMPPPRAPTQRELTTTRLMMKRRRGLCFVLFGLVDSIFFRPVCPQSAQPRLLSSHNSGRFSQLPPLNARASEACDVVAGKDQRKEGRVAWGGIGLLEEIW